MIKCIQCRTIIIKDQASKTLDLASDRFVGKIDLILQRKFIIKLEPLVYCVSPDFNDL